MHRYWFFLNYANYVLRAKLWDFASAHNFGSPVTINNFNRKFALNLSKKKSIKFLHKTDKVFDSLILRGKPSIDRKLKLNWNSQELESYNTARDRQQVANGCLLYTSPSPRDA